MAYQRFLVCDSDELVRQSVRDIVALSGHEIVDALDGTAALTAVTGGDFKCAFLDIDQYENKGFEIAQHLRGTSVERRPRLIAMTKRASIRDFELSRDAGFDICLMKPLAEKQLIIALANMRVQPWSRRAPWKSFKKTRGVV